MSFAWEAIREKDSTSSRQCLLHCCPVRYFSIGVTQTATLTGDVHTLDRRDSHDSDSIG